MKKISILLALVLSFTMLTTACGKAVDSKTTDSSSSSASSETSVQSGDNSSESNAKMPTDMMKVSKTRYGYSTLTDDEKDIYDKLLKSIYNFDDTVDFGKKVDFETYKKVFTIVYFQETQLFWFYGMYDQEEFKDGSSQTATLSYNYDKDTAVKMQAEIDAKVKEITSTFPSKATPVDKLKVIHDFLAKNNTFNKDTVAQTIYGAIINGTSQCEGYAKSLGYLCDIAGIENLMVVGENNKELSHAWNMVKIDDEWYDIDLTWDDPEGPTDPNFVLHKYFNVTDAEILNISHFQDAELTAFTPPKATGTKANYFITYKLYAKSVDEAVKLMQSTMIDSAKTKAPLAEIKCSADVYDEAYKTIISKSFDMQNESNSTDGCTKITGITDGSDKNTSVIRINLNY